MRDPEPQAIRLSDYRPTDWLIDEVDLDVNLHATETRVVAKLKVRPNPKGRAGAPLVLDGDELKLDSLAIDGKPVSDNEYAATPASLTLNNPPAKPFTLTIETTVNPSANTKLMGLYRSSSTYCTQCEAEGFRRITYFLDRPDVLAVYRTRIEAERDEAPVLLSNGNLVEEGKAEGSRHYAVWHDPFPKPSYLFALVGGKLNAIHDTFKTMSGREVKLAIYAEPGREKLCGYALDALKRSMRWDERAFGREYDLDVFNIVAVSDFNMGAMENKGLNIFNDKYVLASPETATDGDYAGIESVIAHEYFHNWTGDRITCRDWFQLCLKEGLTVFRDQEFTSDERSRPVKRISDVRALKSAQFSEDAGPLAHPVRPNQYREINNFYTATVYQKGAEVVRMLKTLLGEKGFRAGMDLYFERHDGTAATIEDFLACFADANGVDLSQFKLWYEQAGTPEVAVRGHYDAAHQSFRLEINQAVPPTPGQSAKKPMVIPLAFGLIGKNGKELPLTLKGGRQLGGNILRLTSESETFDFENINERPVPSLNRGFSAPIKLTSNLGDDDYVLLAAHDSDPFNRFDAINTLAMRHLVASTADIRAGLKSSAPLALIAALETTLSDGKLDPAFRAQAVGIPSENDIAREIGANIDPQAIHTARRDLRRTVAQALKDRCETVYASLSAPEPYSPDAASAGRRALKNTCLDYLTALGTPDALARAYRQFSTADNMTDRFAALAILTLHDAPEREKALAEFFDRFREDPLVIDKWLALQAQIPETGTLARVQALMKHPAFSMGNPNRVRSLIGVFAAGNPSQFNREDGKGYEFIADIAIGLDPKNPQVTARLLSAFKSWRVLEPVRRAAAEKALQRVAATAGLSPDSTDIVSRSLA
ncbi:MAG TPA: aminopeptidase N [Xanthobacteraceae bacterium]|nr:aminopeptidase N [Xanthobacteraceae bacterium]